MLPDYCKKNADEYRIKVGDVIKLVPNLGTKATYVLHYRNLELCLSLGMKPTKILSFLMTASYLFASYTFDSQVSLSSCMSIKRGLFFFLSFCCYMPLISGIIDHYCIMKSLKKLGKNKNKLRTIYAKNHENFKNSKPRV